MRRSITQSDALKYETPSQKLGFLSRLLIDDLTQELIQEQNRMVNTITQKTINQLAKTYLNVDEMLIVVVGDKKILTPQLKKLGYDVLDYQE
jgi:zinc protease